MKNIRLALALTIGIGMVAHAETVITARGQINDGEGFLKAFDGDINTKWLDTIVPTWIQIEYDTTNNVTEYAITSANDASNRDPKDFTLFGSNDGVTWDELDSRTGVSFSSRFQTKFFGMSNPGAYSAFRLDIATVGDSGTNPTPLMQLAEIEFGDGAGEPPIIGSFSVDQTLVDAETTVTLSWKDALRASVLSIEPDIGEVTGTTSNQVVITEGITYTLIASNAFGTVTRSVRIEIGAADDLEAYWKLDDGSGEIATDSTGQGNDGGLTNTPTWVDGYYGGALAFLDTSLQCIEVPESPFISPMTEMTIAMWINADDWAGNRRLLQKGDDRQQYRLLAENNLFAFEVGTNRLEIATLPTAATWVHMAATCDGSVMKVYYDGVEQGALDRSGPIPTTTEPLYIGTRNKSVTVTGDYFKGMLDDIQFFSKALTQEEIAAVMISNPTDPIGSIMITIPDGLNAAAISWDTTDRQVYNIERKDSLGVGSTWESITNVTGNGGGISVTTAVENAEGFYQVVTP